MPACSCARHLLADALKGPLAGVGPISLGEWHTNVAIPDCEPTPHAPERPLGSTVASVGARGIQGANRCTT